MSEPDEISPAGRRISGDASDARLSREGGDRGLSLSERFSHALHRLQEGSPLHRMRLKGQFPLKLLAAPTDPVEGDKAAGEALARDGVLIHAGHSASMRDFVAELASAPPAWRDWGHGFGMLRDLATAVDRSVGARLAEKLTRAWLETFAEFDPAAWRADLTGTRILMWCCHAPWILASDDLVHRSAVLNHLARAARHLDRAHDKSGDGLPRLRAIAGLLTAGLLLPGGEARQAKAEALLQRTLDLTLLPDGGVVSRSPVDAVELLELLLTVNAVYAKRGVRPAEALSAAIPRAVAGLKALQLGDGQLTAMHGGVAGLGTRAERAVAASGAMERATKNGRWSGVQRLSAGRTTVIVDAGPPPIARVSDCAHAGTLAFEMSDGAQRIVVNCGGGRGLAKPLPGQLADLLRTTAAHSTLVVDDTNSTRIREDGALGRGVEEVIVSRQESEEGAWVEASHDGYARKTGLFHVRRLYLSADGSDFRGEDALRPAKGGSKRKSAGHRFDLRFHLAPGIDIAPTADGQGALLQLPGGSVWQFRGRGGALAIDESVVIQPDGAMARTQQLVLSGETGPDGASIAWSLRRAR